MSVDICYSKMRLVLHKLHIFYAFYADDTIIDRRIFAYIYILFNISSHEKKTQLKTSLIQQIFRCNIQTVNFLC